MRAVLQYCVPQKHRHGFSSSHSMRSLSSSLVGIQGASTTMQPSAEGWGQDPFSRKEGNSWWASDSSTRAGKGRCQSSPPSTEDTSKAAHQCLALQYSRETSVGHCGLLQAVHWKACSKWKGTEGAPNLEDSCRALRRQPTLLQGVSDGMKQVYQAY